MILAPDCSKAYFNRPSPMLTMLSHKIKRQTITAR
jgi:hypothetical protein